MIYTPMTIKAMKVAYEAHSGQFDYNGVPYIFHPCHVAEQMDDELSCTVALLHDVVEDTDTTLEELGREFPPQVVEAVELLTHDKSIPYLDYVKKLKTSPLARKVKLADIAHNSDKTRTAACNLPEEKKAYWREKYAMAKAILGE